MIKINDVAFSYSLMKKLFTSISLQVEPGHISGLLGRNGEGKTTLLKLLAGHLIPKSGTIDIDGFIPSQRKVTFLNDVFYLPEVVAVPKGATIECFINTLAPFYPNFSSEAVAEALEAFNLTPNLLISKTSQGQQKKAMLAFALSIGTKLLLLDEPTNGLDIPGKSALRKLLAKQATSNRYIIISTHQVRDLDQIIDHVVVLDNNDILLSSSIYEVTERLTFRPLNIGDTPIYSEQSIGGKMGIFPKEQDDENDAYSTELFFNALMANPSAILQVLSTNQHSQINE